MPERCYWALPINNEFLEELNLEDTEILNTLVFDYEELLKIPISELEKRSEPRDLIFCKVYNNISENCC